MSNGSIKTEIKTRGVLLRAPRSPRAMSTANRRLSTLTQALPSSPVVNPLLHNSTTIEVIGYLLVVPDGHDRKNPLRMAKRWLNHLLQKKPSNETYTRLPVIALMLRTTPKSNKPLGDDDEGLPVPDPLNACKVLQKY